MADIKTGDGRNPLSAEFDLARQNERAAAKRAREIQELNEMMGLQTPRESAQDAWSKLFALLFFQILTVQPEKEKNPEAAAEEPAEEQNPETGEDDAERIAAAEQLRSIRDEARKPENRQSETNRASLIGRAEEILNRQHVTAQTLGNTPREWLRNLIGKYESGNDYNIVWGGKHMPLTQMTIAEVLDWQKHNKTASSAAGKYQCMPGTLRDIVREHNIPLDTKFDEATQDLIGDYLMDRRGYKKFADGDLSLADFMCNLSQEWAALPKDFSGRSYYDGDGLNKAGAKAAQVESTLQAVFVAEARGKQDRPDQDAGQELVAAGGPKNNGPHKTLG